MVWRNQSLRYRLLHLVEARPAGLAPVLELDHRMHGLRPDAVLNLRPTSPSRATGRRARGAAMIADYDDLIFAEPAAFPSVQAGKSRAWSVKRQMDAARQALLAHPHVTVSTEPLADMVRSIHPTAQVGVLHNLVSAAWLRQGDATCRPWRPGDPCIIRYLPGSKFHERDFSVAAPGLAAFLHESSDVHLEVVGPVPVEGHGFPPARVSRRDPVPFEHLPDLLASAWVTIAPLEDTVFTRCKSAIKFLESAAFGCPCVATPIPDMVRCQGGGALLAEDGPAWLERLRALTDPDLRMALGHQGRSWVRSHATTDHFPPAHAALISGWIARDAH
ncbi:MAG: hypothetical protein RLZZ127_141 [Planctomycetota bacterium]|jgi:glycosyltransferase involved in cell wall biosynthesis